MSKKKNCSWRTLFRVTLEFPPPRWFHYFALSFTFQVWEMETKGAHQQPVSCHRPIASVGPLNT